MWSIGEMKRFGRQCFKRNYWKAVLVGLILSILASQGISRSYNSSDDSSDSSYFEDYSDGSVPNDWESVDGEDDISALPFDADAIVDDGDSLFDDLSLGWSVFGIQLSGMLFLVVALIVMILKIVVGYCLEVGCRRFFMVNLYEKAKLDEIGFAFENNWKNCTITLLLRDIKLFLWTLLLVVPGIIKSYEYRMVAYLLAENPDMDRREAFARSKEMMMGNKWRTFLLDLSFIGWSILNAFIGLVGIFWSNPYIYSTNAALYDHLRFQGQPGQQYAEPDPAGQNLYM